MQMVKQPLICQDLVSVRIRCLDDLLAGKYKDRFQVANSLFKKLDTQMFTDICNLSDQPPKLTEWHDEDLPKKIYSYRHEGPIIGYDEDIMVGPHDWEWEKAEDQIGDYVVRKKCYLYDWTLQELSSNPHTPWEQLSELKYFCDMHTDFVEVLKRNARQQYDVEYVSKFLHKLMVIEYSTPTADDSNRVAHRRHNTERFGPDHCDETLAGLHLGENYVEFQTRDSNGDWNFHPELAENSTLWMHGEHAIDSGYEPTYHRMIHNPDPKHGTRYSIIFDLQVRYD